MPAISLALEHGRTLADAQHRLESIVSEATTRFRPLIERADWTEQRDQVVLNGKGFRIELRVDATQVHLTGNINSIAGLLARPLAAGIKTIVQRTFAGQLPKK